MKYRNVIEKCEVMTNNDEVVFDSNIEIKQEDLPSGRLVLSRPIYEIEIQNGYVFNPTGEFKDGVPEVTILIDSFIRTKQAIDFWINAAKVSPSEALGRVIGGNYYDCLSGGTSGYTLAIYKFLAEDARIDKAVNCYPDVTIQDFLNEVSEKKNIPNFSEIHKTLPEEIKLLT